MIFYVFHVRPLCYVRVEVFHKANQNLFQRLYYFSQHWDMLHNMVFKLNEIDRKILKLLQRDVSISMDKLAEKVDLSRNACWRKVKNLEARSVIQRRVAILDPEAVGVGLLVLVMVRTNRHDSDWLKLFHEAVRHMPEIVSAHRMSGELDYVLRVRVATVREYDIFYQRLISKVQVADISASFVMEDIKDTTELPM